MMLEGIGVFVRARRHLWRAALRHHPGGEKKKKKASTCNGSVYTVDEIITSSKKKEKERKKNPEDAQTDACTRGPGRGLQSSGLV